MVENFRNSDCFFWSTLPCKKKLEQIVARTQLVMHQGTFRVEHSFIYDAISLDFWRTEIPFDLSVLKHFYKQHVPLFCIVNYRE